MREIVCVCLFVCAAWVCVVRHHKDNTTIARQVKIISTKVLKSRTRGCLKLLGRMAINKDWSNSIWSSMPKFSNKNTSFYIALSSRAQSALHEVPSQQQQITHDETCCQWGASTNLFWTQTALLHLSAKMWVKSIFQGLNYAPLTGFERGTLRIRSEQSTLWPQCRTEKYTLFTFSNCTHV